MGRIRFLFFLAFFFFQFSFSYVFLLALVVEENARIHFGVHNHLQLLICPELIQFNYLDFFAIQAFLSHFLLNNLSTYCAPGESFLQDRIRLNNDFELSFLIK